MSRVVETLSTLNSELMGRGKAIPDAVRWIIIRLSTTMTGDDISMYTDVSTRSVRKIIAHFKQTGDVERPQQMNPRLHKSLCDYDIEVLVHFISCHAIVTLNA